jgi:5-methylcytosine-specific restriction endonuclease McrA
MASPPGYKRNYKEEEKTAKARGEDVGNAERHKARRLELKKGLVRPHDGNDVDHIKPISKGGHTTAGNLRVESAHQNRSYKRTHTGAIKE